MLAIILALACLGFYAFIGTASKDAVQLALALFWAALIIASIVAEILY